MTHPPGLPLLRLDDPRAADAQRTGGKASGLARLRAAGLPTPDGFVVPGAALREALDAAGLLDEALAVDRTTAPGLRAAVQRLPIPEAWADGWTAAAARLGPRLAVRSSARAEDGRLRSFAGQHASLVGLTVEALVDAVRAVWASLWHDEALVYRGKAPAPDEMAVLVQPLVRSSCAGVLFTADPLGDPSTLVIEAAWGRGEAVVGGHTAPQRYVLRRRPRGWLRRGGALEPGPVDVPPQQDWWPPDGGDVAPLPRALRQVRALPDDAVRALAALGLAAERALGEPLDVEWSRDADGAFVLLQARPLTAPPPPASGDVLWTRRFLGERWPDPATPLGWSLVEPLLAWFVAWPATQARLGGGPPLRLVDGRPYVNATIFRRLAFRLPGVGTPAFLLELLPPDEADALRRRGVVLPDLRVVAAAAREAIAERRWRRFAWDPLTNPERWRAFERRLDAALRTMGAPPATDAEGVARVETLLALARDYVGVHVVSLLYANLAWQLLGAALRDALPDRAERLADELAASPSGNATVRTHRELQRLAAGLGPDDVARLGRGAALSPDGRGALLAFLDRHGHRALASWEITSPRWASEPDRLAPLLAAVRALPAADDRHAAALDEVLRDAPRSRLPWLLTLVWWTRRYVLLREHQRQAFDRLLDALRRTLLGLGERLAARGALDGADDVAFLTWPELQEAVGDGPPDLRAWVERRRRAHAAHRDADPPIDLTGDEGPPLGTGRRLRGLGVVAGRARGRVRVLASPADAPRLEPGDVLVAHALDPSWTPLLLTAGAAVLELGGMLSHGAVVAREYRVPMVVDVRGATRLLRDGDEVTVDGRSGAVWLHP